jgi:hypothetical protein
MIKGFMIMLLCTSSIIVSMSAAVNDDEYYIARPQKKNRCCGNAGLQASELQSWLQRAPVNNTSDLVRERIENELTRAEAAMH